MFDSRIIKTTGSTQIHNRCKIEINTGDTFMDNDYKIIAVDFDGTLCYSNWPDLGAPNTALINYLLREKAAGNKLILWTCRAGKALSDATRWCLEQGLTFDAVNDNLPEIVEFYGNNSRKITCDLYIDDKSVYIDSAGRLRGADL